MKLPRRPAASLAVSLALCLALLSRAVCAVPLTEFEVKAAYVVNILKLTERRSSARATGDLVLCLLSAGAMEAPLRSLEGTTIRGRKLRVQAASKGDLALCDVLFVGRTAGNESQLAKAHAQGLLTIGHDGDFVPRDGMVALVVENRRVVVEINRLAVQSGEWRFSSHLLEIAHLITGGSR